MNTLYLMVGIPGSGKSTWVQNRIAQTGHGIWISRDKIRFSMLEEDEDYFAHENEVIKKFISQINNAIASNNNEDIYIDATHLNEKARARVINQIGFERTNYELKAVVFTTPVSTCVRRRENSTGRENIPASVVRRMNSQLTYPGWDVSIQYDDIIKVDGRG